MAKTAEEMLRELQSVQTTAQSPTPTAQATTTTAPGPVATTSIPNDGSGYPTAPVTPGTGGGTAPTTPGTTDTNPPAPGSQPIVIPETPATIAPPVHTPRPRPTTYEWTGDAATDGEAINYLRNKYDYEAPKPGQEMYGAYFGGINGQAQALGYRNDNPIDYSSEGAGFVSQRIDPNDPALGYYIASFKKNESENWSWANGEYWANNKRTGDAFVDDARVLDWYWRDLARRMDKSNSFFDSTFGKIFSSIAIGWATAGVGNMFGPWAASLFGGIMAGATSDWNPMKMIMGAVGPFTNHILNAAGVTGVMERVLPDWADFLVPETGYDFDYGIDDALMSGGWSAGQSLLENYQRGLTQPEASTVDPFAQYAGEEELDATTPIAPILPTDPFVLPPSTVGPGQATMPGQGTTPEQGTMPGQGTTPANPNPFDPTQGGNPFNPDPYTGYALGGLVNRRKQTERKEPQSDSRKMYDQLMRKEKEESGEERPVYELSNDDFINYANRRLPMASLVPA